jgi:hypothetical protein
MKLLPSIRGKCATFERPKGRSIVVSTAQLKENDTMPSRTYELFVEAMEQRKQVVCYYQGYRRELCPIILGHKKTGEEAALTYQFAGESSRGLPRKGAWRCLWLSEVSNAQLRDGPWRSGPSHTQPQSCVDVVDLDVNPSSPYKPRRRHMTSRLSP